MVIYIFIVWFINLAPIRDHNLLATTTGHALGLTEIAGRLAEERLVHVPERS